MLAQRAQRGRSKETTKRRQKAAARVCSPSSREQETLMRSFNRKRLVCTAQFWALPRNHTQNTRSQSEIDCPQPPYIRSPFLGRHQGFARRHGPLSSAHLYRMQIQYGSGTCHGTRPCQIYTMPRVDWVRTSSSARRSRRPFTMCPIRCFVDLAAGAGVDPAGPPVCVVLSGLPGSAHTHTAVASSAHPIFFCLAFWLSGLSATAFSPVWTHVQIATAVLCHKPAQRGALLVMSSDRPSWLHRSRRVVPFWRRSIFSMLCHCGSLREAFASLA